jgi:hypothetical protein
MKKIVCLVSILFVGGLTMGSGIALAGKDHFQSAMGEIVNSYLKIRGELAADSLDGVAAEAQKIVKQAEMVEKMHAENPKHGQDMHKKYMLIAEAGKYAAHLTHGDIKTVRKHFADLSKPVITYVEKFGQPQNVSGELFAYYCPMYPGYWLQEDKDAANPLYGKAMLKCANLVEGDKKKQKMLHELDNKHPQKHQMEKEHQMEGKEHKHM